MAQDELRKKKNLGREWIPFIRIIGHSETIITEGGSRARLEIQLEKKIA